MTQDQQDAENAELRRNAKMLGIDPKVVEAIVKGTTYVGEYVPPKPLPKPKG